MRKCFVALILATSPLAAEDAPPELSAIESSGVRSGLAVLLGAGDTALAESLTAEAQIAVDLLTTAEEAKVEAWRAKIDKAGRGGLVSVVPLKDFAALPYPDRFANLVVADLDALAGNAPSEEDLRRIAAPYGAVCLRKNGQWKVEKIPLAPELDEWTHFDHGPDGNPVSKDRAVGHIRGLQWASYDHQGSPASTMRIGGGAYIRAHRAQRDDRAGSLLVAREATNGMLRWMIDEPPGMDAKRSRVFEASWCIADGRLHGLVGNALQWGQCIDLATGKTLLAYDQGVPAPDDGNGKMQARRTEEERRWKIDVTIGGGSNTRGPYTHGVVHISLHGMIVQGGNLRLEGEPKPYPLGPARYPPDRAPRGETEPPKSVTPSALYQGRVAALDPATGRRLWNWDAPQGLLVGNMVGGEGAIAVGLTHATVSLGVHYRNRFNRLAEVVVLDAKTGRQRWRSDHVKDFLVHHLAIAEGGLFVANHAISIHIGELIRLVRFDLRSGKIDFDENPQGANPLRDWRNRFVVLDGRVRMGGSRKLTSIDARTGKDLEMIATEVVGHGASYPGRDLGHCSTWRAAANGWLSGRFCHYIPFDGKIESRPSVARNICDEGHYPGYGLVYSGYHPGCYCATYLVGAVAMHGLPPEKPVPDGQRLTRGPAWGTALGSAVAADQWPTFRGNMNRGNYVEAKLGKKLSLVGADRLLPERPPTGPIPRDWAASIIPAMSAPVVADGVMLVSLVHERRLLALDVASGKPLWSGALAARLEYPPTIYRGFAYLGGNDGTVSCLRLGDGALVWRFLAAPTRRRTTIASQTESAWPVPGVVVLRDRLYAAAGRHNQLDGGIHIWRLDPATGAIEGHRVIDGRSYNQPANDLPPTIDYQGRTNDILAIDRAGRAVHLRDIAIDPLTLDWLNLCKFDRRVVARGRIERIENADSDEEYSGFKETELAVLNTKPLETHNAMYHPSGLNYGSAGLGIKQEWIDYSRKVHGRDMAIGPGRLVTLENGVVPVPLDDRGVPVLLPRNASKEVLGKLRPALTKVLRQFTGVAMTPDRVVLTVAANPLRKEPPAVWLMDATGALLAEAELPADPLPGCLAIAGKQIVVGTINCRIHRFSTGD
jgi:outer membrane protein assembly factor BamB